MQKDEEVGKVASTVPVMLCILDDFFITLNFFLNFIFVSFVSCVAYLNMSSAFVYTLQSISEIWNVCML